MNIENPDIQVPLRVKVGGVKDSAEGPDPEKVAMIAGMGFPEKQAARALRKCDQNVERAMEWIFSHMDEPDSEDEMAVDQVSSTASAFSNTQPDKGTYKLQSFITHLGASVHAGHYVCHIKKDGQWTYFNDAKVATDQEPPIGKGYIYFFRK